MAKLVVITQPRFLPHVSYLRKVELADILVQMVDVKINWRFVERRNKIRLHDGKDKWLSMPTTNDVISTSKITDMDFAEKMRRIVQAEYCHSKYYDEKLLKYLLFDPVCDSYCQYLTMQLERLKVVFGINTELKNSTDFNITKKKQEYLEQILGMLGEDVIYLSGESGKSYIKDFNYQIMYFDNRLVDIPYYSIIDTLFTIGIGKTTDVIKGKKVNLWWR